MVVSSFTAGEAAQLRSQECGNVSAANISHLIGLQYHRVRKVENVHTLTEEVQGLLNRTQNDVRQIDAAINNITTTELRELAFSQTCDTNIPSDCCQVRPIMI